MHSSYERAVRWLVSGRRTRKGSVVSRTLRAEPLEQRQMLSVGVPAADFLIDSVNYSATSRYGVDEGDPMLPLFTDYYASGTYGEIDDITHLTVDANARDTVLAGYSSIRADWNSSGGTPNGYFQFDVSPNIVNRPRDIAEFGDASSVRFFAKGDTNGQQIRANVFRVSGSGWQLVRSQTISLSTGWDSYQVNLPSGLRPQDLHAVQFVIGDGYPSGNGTFWLDEVRINAEGFDPLRVVQSYRPEAADDPEVTVYANRSFLYDNALTIKALLLTGDAQGQEMAVDVAQAILATGFGDGSFRNDLGSGHVLDGTGQPLPPYSVRRTLGDNAWLGMALMDVYRFALPDGDGLAAEPFLTAARGISDWAETELKDTGAVGGYRGGYDEFGNAVAWRSTEHNIDLFVLNHALASELSRLGDFQASIYADRAAHAGDFVMQMYDNVEGKFWTGTGNTDAINQSSVPLDAQLWAILALGESSQYGNSINWDLPLAWAEQHLVQTDGPYTGFTYSSGTTTSRVWFEGVAQGGVVFSQTGDTTAYQQSMQTIDYARLHNPHGDGTGTVAASSDGLTDPQLGALYDARLHVGATAWAYFAHRQVNPFFLSEARTSEIGVHRPVGNAGYFIQDPNGNGYWDGGDRFFEFGYYNDTPIIGDWNGDGLDEIGVHRAVGNAGYFIQDFNGNGYWDGGDRYFEFGYSDDTPIIGDWNGDGYDEIGVHRPVGNAGYFIQDFNGNGYWDGGDRYFEFGYGSDTPIIGDWNGSIGDEIGVHRAVGNAGYFIQDFNGNGSWDGGDRYFEFGYGTDLPIIGDWNGDGTDQIGVHREVGNAGYFIEEYNGNGYWDGEDRFFEFGYADDIPIIGNWAPASPLMAAEGEVVPDKSIAALKTSDLAPIVEEALASFEAIGLDARMKGVEYAITDLPGAMLGLAEHSTIYLDYNAAGHGWFVDLTPAVDEEFERIGSGESLYALDPVASDTMDLLTVVSHELGHVLGLEDLDSESDSLMSCSLEKGLRHRPGDAERDAVLAGYRTDH